MGRSIPSHSLGTGLRPNNNLRDRTPTLPCGRGLALAGAATWVFELEEEDQLECWKNRLQLNGDLHGLQALELIGREKSHEMAEEALLDLNDLGLDGVNLNDGRANLRWIATGTEEIGELLHEDLTLLNERHEARLAGLEEQLKFAGLPWSQLEERGYHVEGSDFLPGGTGGGRNLF